MLGPRLAKELSPEPGSDPVGLAKIIPLEDEGAEGGPSPAPVTGTKRNLSEAAPGLVPRCLLD